MMTDREVIRLVEKAHVPCWYSGCTGKIVLKNVMWFDTMFLECPMCFAHKFLEAPGETAEESASVLLGRLEADRNEAIMEELEDA